MKALVLEDAPILIPNKEHKNFTEGGKFIEADSIIHGQPKNVKGLRKGEPFVYRFFLTNKNELIYINKIKPMETVEVSLGADSGVTPTKVDLIPAERQDNRKLYGAIIGGVIGFAYCKYKKHDVKKSAMYIGVGALAGFLIGKYIAKNKSVIVKPSK